MLHVVLSDGVLQLRSLELVEAMNTWLHIFHHVPYVTMVPWIAKIVDTVRVTIPSNGLFNRPRIPIRFPFISRSISPIQNFRSWPRSHLHSNACSTNVCSTQKLTCSRSSSVDYPRIGTVFALIMRLSNSASKMNSKKS